MCNPTPKQHWSKAVSIVSFRRTWITKFWRPTRWAVASADVKHGIWKLQFDLWTPILCSLLTQDDNKELEQRSDFYVSHLIFGSSCTEAGLQLHSKHPYIVLGAISAWNVHEAPWILPIWSYFLGHCWWIWRNSSLAESKHSVVKSGHLVCKKTKAIFAQFFGSDPSSKIRKRWRKLSLDQARVFFFRCYMLLLHASSIYFNDGATSC